MKKLMYWAAALCLLSGCTGGGVSQQEFAALKLDNDLLRQKNQQMEMQIGVVADALNEIALQEDIIFVDDTGTDIKDRDVLRNRMETIRGRLAAQREKIAELEQSLANGTSQNGKLTKLVSQLKAQLAEKDERIASLEAQLEDNSITISRLRDQVTTISMELAETTMAKESLETAVMNQDQLLNEGYYIVATKKDLKQMGLTEGLFKKKLNVDNVDKSKFTRVDIRDTEMIRIPGKSPKLMTEKPSDSYEIAANADGSSTLYVKDPVRFWETSKFLVIQIKD